MVVTQSKEDEQEANEANWEGGGQAAHQAAPRPRWANRKDLRFVPEKDKGQPDQLLGP